MQYMELQREEGCHLPNQPRCRLQIEAAGQQARCANAQLLLRAENTAEPVHCGVR
jgi:hypothetical protein